MGRIARSFGLAMLAAMFAWAATPAAVLDMLREATEQLAAADSRRFLDHFDRSAPGYPAIAQQVSLLVARDGATSTIEILRDQGDETHRTLEIDWVMRVGASRRKHVKVTMTVSLQRGDWKITSLAPPDFFTLP